MISHGTLSTASSASLRPVLRLNSLFSAGSGVGMILGTGPLTALLGLELSLLLRVLGVGLVIYGASLVWVARQARITRSLALAAVLLDALWVVGSVFVLLAARIGRVPLTAGGAWLIGIIAAVVAVFAALQFHALRREPRGRRDWNP